MEGRGLEKEQVEPGSKPGMTKREPRWVIPFLRALARTGEARVAAEDAGIDHSTAYARRRAHAEFAGLWLGALAAHRELKKREEEARSGLSPLARPPPRGSTPPPPRGEGLMGRGWLPRMGR